MPAWPLCWYQCVICAMMERVEWACRGWPVGSVLSPALDLGYSCRDLGCPEEVFCAATGEELFEGMLWGLPGFEGWGGGGKLYKEKAKLLFPRHFLHLHCRQWFWSYRFINEQSKSNGKGKDCNSTVHAESARALGNTNDSVVISQILLLFWFQRLGVVYT